MKHLLTACIMLTLSWQASAQTAPIPDPGQKTDTLEAGCGLCQFEMKGDDCALAVRINGKAYYVDGTHIDAHGDAHAPDGFCSMIRKAVVQGQLSGGRYKVTYFKLLPLPAKP